MFDILSIQTNKNNCQFSLFTQKTLNRYFMEEIRELLHWHSADTPPTLRRHSTETSPMLHQHFTDTPLTLYQHSTDTPPTLHQHFTDTPPIVRRLLAICRLTVYQRNCWPSVCQWSIGGVSVEWLTVSRQGIWSMLQCRCLTFTLSSCKGRKIFPASQQAGMQYMYLFQFCAVYFVDFLLL